MSCGCQTTSSNCVREPFNANFVRPLQYVRGVDANGCVSYAPATSLTLLNVQDTNTLDLTLNSGVISGDVRISGATGNQVQALADGLFVPAGAGLQVTDTSTIDLTLVGGVLSAQTIISPNAGNALQALSNGLFVPAASSLSVQDTTSVDLTLAGGVLSANVIISPNTGNALQVLPNGLYVGPGGYSLSDCAGNPLPVGAQVLTCPSGVLLLNINDQLIASNPPGTALRTLSSKNCPEPANNDYIIIADNAGNVRYTRMREAVFHNLIAGSPIVFPNLPLVTLQPPNTTTGIIDSASFTNPRSCFGVFVKGVLNAFLQHSFNQNNSSSIANAQISNLRSLTSSIVNHNTPGITNTPLTSHAWRNQSIFLAGFSTERVVDLGVGILPGATTTFNREIVMGGATDFYYVTVDNWSASFSVLAL